MGCFWGYVVLGFGFCVLGDLWKIGYMATRYINDYVATRYVNDYVAKGILKSPMYIKLKNAVALWGVWGVSLSKITRTRTTNAI